MSFGSTIDLVYYLWQNIKPSIHYGTYPILTLTHSLSLSHTHTHAIDISAHELAFGEYLGAYSEKEYTNAGQVMKSTGKVLQMEAKARSAAQDILL